MINAAGPAAYWTGLPLNAILGAFAADEIPASLSSNAGTFVCNALFYKLQDWASRQGRTLSGFVNLPPVDEREHSQHGLTLDQQIRAGPRRDPRDRTLLCQTDRREHAHCIVGALTCRLPHVCGVICKTYAQCDFCGRLRVFRGPTH